ncbi:MULTISPECIES: hypothetical protein [Desertifilum]|nr:MULTISPECIES: hypothetical protein [Desertifilum]
MKWQLPFWHFTLIGTPDTDRARSFFSSPLQTSGIRSAGNQTNFL